MAAEPEDIRAFQQYRTKVPLVETTDFSGKPVQVKLSEPPKSSIVIEERKESGKIAGDIVSSERIAFLEKIERLLGLDEKVRELEEENEVLRRIAMRQQLELDELHKVGKK